ncbi:ester cyclase [Pseudoruegeria sp. SK021]|uniref:ester cyclase n=1 Tax=Pseudoruegeria sp. SK021 TaxID=1933035 RepID=UPI000A259DB8|nr:ester cyclase [Pseudoruegeria sp. SK021]OSP54526.1 hypothetical protein BV911_12390 [Pseudoruegeria sp. SK021]
MTRLISPDFTPPCRTDVPAFARALSNRLWEDRNIAGLDNLLAPDVILRTPDQVLHGAGAVLAALLAERAACPDLQALCEDTIWCDTTARQGDGEPGFLCANRLTALAGHSGDGLFGPASGTRLRARMMLDVWCTGDRVREGWLIRDTAAIHRALGQDPKSAVRQSLSQDSGLESCAPPLTPDTDPDGAYGGRGDDSPTGDHLSDLVKRIMTGEFSAIAHHYDRACALAYPGGTDEIGHLAAERFWMGLRSAFPSASFRIDHCMGLKDAGAAPRAALRWSLYGKHDGFGAFGPPTGAYVYVMGMTHAEFGPHGLRRDWTLLDVAAIWKQILLATGAV